MIWRLAALAVPVLAGIVWMALGGAPDRWLLMQGTVLAVGSVMVAFGDRVAIAGKPLGIALVCLLFLPLLIGPEINGERRWIGAGPVMLTTALLCLPPLSVLLARARRSWLVGPLGLIFLAGVIQTDASILVAMAFVILALGGRNLVALVGGALLLALGGLIAARDMIDAVSFVEVVLQQTALTAPWMAAVLAAALLAAGACILLEPDAPAQEKRSLTACLGGLVAASLIGPYPTPLIGYGAASILGLSLALVILGRDPARSLSQ